MKSAITYEVGGETTGLSKHIEKLAAANERAIEALDQHNRGKLNGLTELELLRMMIDVIPDNLFVKDRESRFVLANKGVAAQLGRVPEALIGKTDFDLHPHERAAKFFADEQAVMATGKPLDTEEFIFESSGKIVWHATSKFPLRDDTGAVVGIVGICRDVTTRKLAEAQVQHMAHHDALTGLPNRVLLNDRLSQAIAKAERNERSFVLAFFDLDKFKVINDKLGHGAGDVVLRIVADRMLRTVRETDTVARLAGDEFIILFEEPDLSKGAPRAIEIIERVKAAVAEPIMVDGHSCRMSCSVGIANYPRDARSADELIAAADVGMYQAKATGIDTLRASSSEAPRIRSSG